MQGEVRNRRNRRQPVYLQDYVSGEGLSEEEGEFHSLDEFTSNDDPTSFDEAVRYSNGGLQ